MFNQTNLNIYKHYVRERYQLWVRRQMAEPAPWTSDRILSTYKFTNNFRVLDPGSQFVLTDLLTDNPEDFIARCFLYRYTNLPSTWTAIRDVMGDYPTAAEMGEPLAQEIMRYRDAGNTVFSGAYIIMPTPGKVGADKVWEAVNLTKIFVEYKMDDFLRARSQEDRFKTLTSLPGVGKFMAMQILTDWGYGQNTNPEEDFIVAGPGAKRGAAYLNPDITPEQVIRELLETQWRADPEVRIYEHHLTLMDIQNTLCELSKYMRYRTRTKPLRTTPYQPAHPGIQPAPTLPRWML